MAKKTAPHHTYHVAYKRTPKGMVFTTVIKNVTLQEIVQLITEMEPDDFEAEILYIIKE